MFNSYTITSLLFDEMKCTGCRRCVEVCPHGVFEMNERRVHVVRAEACMECGACQLNCRAGAIHVESGVGCATAMMLAALRGKEEVTCGGETSCGCG